MVLVVNLEQTQAGFITNPPPRLGIIPQLTIVQVNRDTNYAATEANISGTYKLLVCFDF